VCLAKWWASVGTVDLSYSVTFQGVSAEPKEIVLHSAESIARVDLTSRAQVEVISIKILLHAFFFNRNLALLDPNMPHM
jgi:tripeptidyl-peptidase-2